MNTSAKRQRGLTLIELMIVVAVLAILGSIAIPIYGKQTTKARRADATTTLMEAALEMETCRAQRLTYTDCDDVLPARFDLTEGGMYSIGAAITDGGNGYTLTATRVADGKQAGDTKCGNLTLTSTGAKGHTGSESNTSVCWQN